MINLRNDIYARLCIAARRYKEIDKRNAMFDLQRNIVLNAQKEEKKPAVAVQDDTVKKIIEDPEVGRLRKELDTAEQAFELMRVKGYDLELIMRIEQRIDQLKKLMEVDAS